MPEIVPSRGDFVAVELDTPFSIATAQERLDGTNGHAVGRKVFGTIVKVYVRGRSATIKVESNPVVIVYHANWTQMTWNGKYWDFQP